MTDATPVFYARAAHDPPCVARLRWPIVTLAIALIATICQLIPTCGSALQLARTDFGWWRPITCHLVHWSFEHFAWDALTFVALGVACELIDRRKAILAILTSAIAIPLAIHFLQPQLMTYRGLSGIDTALFVLLALHVMRRSRLMLVVGVLAIAGMLGKSAFEMITQLNVFVKRPDASFVPVPLAHLVGGMCGAVAFFARLPRSHSRSSRVQSRDT